MTTELFKQSKQDPNRCACGGTIIAKDALDWLNRRTINYTCDQCGATQPICVERCPTCH
jgi:hypothetical protein